MPGEGGGARQFLVFNSPDLGLLPALNPPLNIPLASAAGMCFSLLFNLGTQNAVLPPECGFLSGIPGLQDILDDLEFALP